MNPRRAKTTAPRRRCGRRSGPCRRARWWSSTRFSATACSPGSSAPPGCSSLSGPAPAGRARLRAPGGVSIIEGRCGGDCHLRRIALLHPRCAVDRSVAPRYPACLRARPLSLSARVPRAPRPPHRPLALRRLRHLDDARAAVLYRPGRSCQESSEAPPHAPVGDPRFDATEAGRLPALPGAAEEAGEIAGLDPGGHCPHRRAGDEGCRPGGDGARRRH